MGCDTLGGVSGIPLIQYHFFGTLIIIEQSSLVHQFNTPFGETRTTLGLGGHDCELVLLLVDKLSDYYR